MYLLFAIPRFNQRKLVGQLRFDRIVCTVLSVIEQVEFVYAIRFSSAMINQTTYNYFQTTASTISFRFLSLQSWHILEAFFLKNINRI